MTEEREKKRIKTKHDNQEIKDEPQKQESIKDDSNNLDNIEEDTEQDNLSNPDSWDPESSCWGCREGQPNQLAHMDPGGCLYQDVLENE